MTNQPDCCLCGEPCEPWVAGEPNGGYGHNPDPLGGNDPDARCCNSCNETRVIPTRLLNYIRKQN